jgi:hypothetical protein
VAAVAVAVGVVVAAAVAGGDREDDTMTTLQKVTLILIAGALTSTAALGADTQKKFAKPDDAVRALVVAAGKGDQPQLVAILGPQSDEIVSSGDPVADRAAAQRLTSAAKQRTRLETTPSGAVIAHLGADDWPLPVPIVKDGNEWRFDGAAGREEILNRRIGRNELKAITVARVYVDAQREHAKREHDYAQKLRSEPGKHDGLYWDDPTGKDPSPLGPLLAEASAEGYGNPGAAAGPQPYHGYYYKILIEQGARAPGGAKKYVNDGKMTGGFALLAYPAEHGASGVMTFIVGPQGVVYQKDLGDKSADAAKAMTAYDPDDSWTPVRD